MLPMASSETVERIRLNKKIEKDREWKFADLPARDLVAMVTRNR
jgi:hypothetical protein